MKFLLSSYAFSTFPLEEVFLSVKKIGFDGIELVILPQFAFKAGEVRRLADKHNVPVLSIHQPMWHWPHTTRGMLSRLASYANMVGAKNIAAHMAVFRFWPKKKIFPFIKSLEKEHDITISLENSWPSSGEMPPDWAWQKNDLEQLVKNYNINLTLDDPKFLLSSYSSADFFAKQKNNITNIHIHGIHRERIHYPISGSDYNPAPFLKKIRELGYDKTLVLEVFPLKKLSSRLGKYEVSDIIEKDFSLVRKIIKR